MQVPVGYFKDQKSEEGLPALATIIVPWPLDRQALENLAKSTGLLHDTEQPDPYIVWMWGGPKRLAIVSPEWSYNADKHIGTHKSYTSVQFEYMLDKILELENLRERYENVRSRIEIAALSANRSPDQITLIAVSKTHSAKEISRVHDLGVQNFGENRIQEAESKIVDVGRQAARWHLVGHLQTNKARRAIALFDVIHSLDSASLAKRLDRLCVQARREELPVLIQIDLAGEQSKTGIVARELPGLLEALKDCQRLRLMGLMTLPPYFEDAECARPFFKALRELRDELKLAGHFGQLRGELSMGMSHDFEIAIEEGATMLRVGTAIFGERIPESGV